MQQLEHLQERLLHAGVSPRHVRRYLSELRDHYDDALRDEQAKGLGTAAAEQAAWARLGDEDHLAQSVLARPELRSLAAKYPRAVFGIGPLVLWIAAVVLTTLAFVAVVGTASKAGWLPMPGPDLGGRISGTVQAMCLFYARILPVILGVTMMWIAIRQRRVGAAVFVGMALVAVFAGTTSISVEFSPTATRPNELEIGSSLAPFLVPFTDAVGQMRIPELAEGLARAAVMFALMLVPYVVLVRRRRSYG